MTKWTRDYSKITDEQAANPDYLSGDQFMEYLRWRLTAPAPDEQIGMNEKMDRDFIAGFNKGY